MVNRVLIRIKVVHLLYSYFLSRSEFRIDQAPETTSRDRRYAYTAYVDLLLLLLELSGYSVTTDGKSPLAPGCVALSDNKVANALASNDTVRDIILMGNSGIASLDGVVNNLYSRITASAIYADYSKSRVHSLDDDVRFWTVVLESVIARDPALEEALRADPAFTMAGYEMAVANLCNTLRSYNDSRQLLAKTRKDLELSLSKAYELYLGLLKLIVDLTDEHVSRLDSAKNKYIVTSDDLNPNTRLADNALAAYLRDNEQLNTLVKEYKVNILTRNSTLLKSLLDSILQSDLYRRYVENPVSDFYTDADFWREVMKTIILPSDSLSEELEDSSVFWNDDVNIMGTFVLKTLRQISLSKGEPVRLLDKFKDREDEVFGVDLFKYAVDNYDTYRDYIDMFVDKQHWDTERIAYMDVIIMVAAIAEIINYPAIPVPVTINEFVEIANNYSTEKSGGFINGLLFSIVKHLSEQGIIAKSV